MKRREFIAALGSAVALRPLAAPAQGERVRRIAALMPFPADNAEAQARMRAFREELRKRGWAAGVNVQFDERWTGDNMDLIRSSAAQLVEANPDIILAVGGRVIPILMAQTSTIPIVIPGGTEPVERGYVKSLAKPGGNVTGFALMEISVIGKMLQTLKEIAPGIAHISMIQNPDNPATVIYSREFISAAEALGLKPAVMHIRGFSDIERAIAATAAEPGGGILAASDLTIEALASETVAAVAQHGLPAIYPQRSFVMSGGLMYYGTDRVELYRGGALYVDRILRGEKPGDLPYQQPTKYELVINAKTARTLGLSIPPRLLFTADEVIE
jgi:putative tryptophan/tyrosine transport system substrate-binding protein